MLFNVILLNLMKLMNNNRSDEGLELLWYLPYISHGVPGVWSTTPRNSDNISRTNWFCRALNPASRSLLKVQFSCLGIVMTKCLFSATHKIILNSCRVTLLQWIDNFCDFEIRMLQILVCWTYFFYFRILLRNSSKLTKYPVMLKL